MGLTKNRAPSGVTPKSVPTPVPHYLAGDNTDGHYRPILTNKIAFILYGFVWIFEDLHTVLGGHFPMIGSDHPEIRQLLYLVG